MTSFLVVTGTKMVITKMKAADKAGQVAFMGRLNTAAKLLKRNSMKIVPRDKGHLMGSAFHRLIPAGWQSDAIVGYTAEYAVYVHEDLDKRHGQDYNAEYAGEIASKHKRYKNFHARRPEEQAKFLEKPLRELRPKLLRILAFGV